MIRRFAAPVILSLVVAGCVADRNATRPDDSAAQQPYSPPPPSPSPAPPPAYSTPQPGYVPPPPPPQYSSQPQDGQPPPQYYSQGAPPPQDPSYGAQNPPPQEYQSQPQYAQDDYAPPPPPYTPLPQPVGFWDSHPVPDQYGGGWCLAQGPHLHNYSPEWFDQYSMVDGYFHFGGAGSQFWYSYGHPIPPELGGGWCGIPGYHQHNYPPRMGYRYDPAVHTYVYDPDRSRPVYYSVVRPGPDYHSPPPMVAQRAYAGNQAHPMEPNRNASPMITPSRSYQNAPNYGSRPAPVGQGRPSQGGAPPSRGYQQAQAPSPAPRAAPPMASPAVRPGEFNHPVATPSSSFRPAPSMQAQRPVPAMQPRPVPAMQPRPAPAMQPRPAAQRAVAKPAAKKPPPDQVPAKKKKTR